MFLWIAKNISTIIICAVLIAVVFSICIHLIKNSKKGKAFCGCGCACCSNSVCPMSAGGHQKK